MFSSAQRIIDEINKEKRMAEWKKTSTTSTCPALVAQGVSTHRTGHLLEALLPQGELRE